MAPFTFARSRTARRATRRRLHVESLESRAMMAVLSNVTAQVFGSTLVLTGDNNSNQLVVASVAGGGIAVLGNNTTINGSEDPFVTSRKIVSIVANLNGGADVIGFGNNAEGFADQLDEYSIPAPFDPVDLQNAIDAVDDGASVFSIPGSLTITTGAASDLVGIIGNVGGSVVVNLGSAPSDGFNAFVLGADELDYASRVGGSVTVVGGDQTDGASLLGSRVGGSVVASLGEGNDFFDAADLRVRRSVSVVTAGGDDQVFLHNHDDGPLTVVGGSIVIDTGLGEDYVELATDVNGVLSIVTGAGSDEIAVADSTVGVNAVINAGGDADAVGLTNVQVRYNLLVFLEGGNDLLTLVEVQARNAFLYGGLGNNELRIDAASRAGIRKLRSYQFQTVSTIV